MLGRRVVLCAVLGFVVALQVGVRAGPAGAVEIPVFVATEGEYRAALNEPCTGADTLVIGLQVDITLAGVADPTFAGPCALTINGNGHTIDGAGNSRSVVNAIDLVIDPVVSVNDLVAVNGKTPDDGGIETEQGGAIRAAGPVTVVRSEFRSNHAKSGGGAVFAVGGTEVLYTAFIGNTASGGVLPSGGALTSGGEITDLVNSTFVGNSADFTAGAVLASNSLGVFLGHVTFASNSAPTGAHMRMSASTIRVVFGTSFSNPLGGGTSCDIAATMSAYSQSHSAAGDTSCGLLGPGDVQGAATMDPLLGPLGFNGGPTQTMVPAAESPLVDAIPLASCAPDPFDVDQRAVARPQSGACDVGAVEFVVPFYVLVDTTGFVYAFPEDRHFGNATVTPGSEAIDIDINRQATGYYILDNAGVVHPVGSDVVSQGNFPTGLLRPGETIVALSLTETGLGYWIFTSGGQAVPFGDAPDIGDVADLPLQGAIVDGAPFPPGFYMAGADGGLFTPPGTGQDVPFFGSVPSQLPGVPLNEPIVTIYTDTDGKGYSLAAGDGGMFNFESVFCGSIPGVLPGVTLNQPVVNAVPFGECYIFFAADGGAFVFGDLPFLGSVPGRGIFVDNITSGDAFGT